MDEVKELKNPLIGVGKTVDVVFGEPIKMEDLLLKCRKCIKDTEKEKLWSEITNRMRKAVLELQYEWEESRLVDTQQSSGP